MELMFHLLLVHLMVAKLGYMAVKLDCMFHLLLVHLMVVDLGYIAVELD